MSGSIPGLGAGAVQQAVSTAFQPGKRVDARQEQAQERQNTTVKTQEDIPSVDRSEAAGPAPQSVSASESSSAGEEFAEKPRGSLVNIVV